MLRMEIALFMVLAFVACVYFSAGRNWNVADTVTSVRIAATISLIFLPLRSVGFLAVYTLTGLTDVLDGWLARKTGTASDFGARLDSIADLLFYGVVLLRLVPILWQKMPVISSGSVYCWALCTLAFAASLEELMIHLCRKDYCADRKSILLKHGGE